MSAVDAPPADHRLPAEDRLLPSGLEAGTAPGDRKFRPDVQGLRAIAVLLVVLFHAGVPGVTGGYVGVDVFFVISGFVITGVLLRERATRGRTSIMDFYARRVRRILPAATLLIVVVALVTYVLLGSTAGSLTADDGRWAAVFLVNFHFTAAGTNYFASSIPPSPLQNLWSLSVEEQFYVVFPTLLIMVAALRRWMSLQARLAVTLVVVIVASYAWSIVQTAHNPTAAYFSPFTRAWELALGALIAVGTGVLKKLPAGAATVVTWTGLAAILIAAFTFPANNNGYPGSMVAVPVVGAALIIAGGIVVPAWGAERVLGVAPCQWLGRLSYSLYLWHWPVLILAAEHAGLTTLSVGDNLWLLLLALAISIATYVAVENPIRRMRLPSRLTVVSGLLVTALTVGVLTLAVASEATGSLSYRVVPAANLTTVLGQVAQSTHITRVPPGVEPPPDEALQNWAGRSYKDCTPGVESSSEPANSATCMLGAPGGKHLMVVYGDSHSLMWLNAFDRIAVARDWRLVVLGKPSCGVDLVRYNPPEGYGPVGTTFTACDQWHRWATAWIRRNRPDLLVVTQESGSTVASASQWRTGLVRALRTLEVSGMRTVVLGNIPTFTSSPPACLTAHPDQVQACSRPADPAYAPYNQAELEAARTVGDAYVNPRPWFCSTVCSPIIGRYDVYLNELHVTDAYAQYLTNVLGQALFATPAR